MNVFLVVSGSSKTKLMFVGKFVSVIFKFLNLYENCNSVGTLCNDNPDLITLTLKYRHYAYNSMKNNFISLSAFISKTILVCLVFAMFGIIWLGCVILSIPNIMFVHKGTIIFFLIKPSHCKK